MPANSCRLCGATSYRQVISRDDQGVIRHSGLYRCSGCSAVFADPKAWREGGTDEAAPLSSPVLRASSVTTAEALASAPRGPDFRTYGPVPGIPPVSDPLAVPPEFSTSPDLPALPRPA
jgi:hypothetical protein